MPSRKLRVLLIEDDPGDAFLIRELLEDQTAVAVEMEQRNRLSSGLESLLSNNVDVCLLDLGLPDSQGLSTLERVIAGGPKIPIVVLTGNDDEELGMAALNNGAQDFLTKDDLNAKQLIRSIRYAVERHRSERALQDSERRFKAIFNNLAVGIDLVDRHGTFREVNKHLADMLGYEANELVGKKVKDVTHPDDLSNSMRNLGKIASGETDSYNQTKRYLRKDGQIVWAELSVSALRDENGRHLATLGVIHDVTSRKRAEQVRTRLAIAVEHSAEAIEITDAQGTILYVNPAFEQITGFGRDEVVGAKPSILKSGRHDQSFYENLWGTIASGGTWRGVFINKRKDGTLYEEEASISPVKDTDGQIVNYVAVKRDVTRENSLQKQLVQAQKMESIATMAGGIAHDFNNLLTIASGYAELLAFGKEKGSPGYEELQAILHATQRGADLVRRILTFSRRLEPDPRPIDLNEELKHAQKLLYRTIPKMIDIQLNLSNEISSILLDPGQLEQAILNLAVNAQHAMPNGGVLRLETIRVRLDEEHCRQRVGIEPGEYALLKVSDTGYGIEEEHLQRIFEPFFSTKAPDQGTGLGLAMVYGIIKGHGGHIECHSQVGQGTTFLLYFPVQDEGEHRQEPGDSGEHSVYGTETILIVDDDDDIRILANRILRKQGYSCILTRSAEEGLEAYIDQGPSIDLVILDLVMPGKGGKWCFDKLVELDPNVKIIISSGFSDSSTKKDLLERAAGFVAKPFKVKEMLKEVRRALDLNYCNPWFEDR